MECRVKPIGKHEVVLFIRAHEHLGTLGQAYLLFGLRAPRGGACWVQLASAMGPMPCGDVVLESGVYLPSALRNGARFLIGRALRYGRRMLASAS